MTYLYRIDSNTRAKTDELALRPVSGNAIGIAVSHENIAYVPYNFSWSMVSGCMIVDLNTFTLNGDFTQNPMTYGYQGPGVTIDKDGVAWTSGLRVGNQSGIIRITPEGERTYYQNAVAIGGLNELVTDDQEQVWSISQQNGLVRIDPETGQIDIFALADWNPGSGRKGISYGSGYLWLVDPDLNAVRKIEPANGTELARIPVGTSPFSIGDLTGYEAHKAGLDISLPEITPLAMDTPVEGELAGDVTRQYYRLSTSGARFVRITLDDADDAGTAGLYTKHLSLPSPSRYDACSIGGSSADQEIIIPVDQPGDCYILASSENGSGSYTITAAPLESGISSVSPAYYGNSADAVLTLKGAGFQAGMSVVIIDSQGNEYQAGFVDIDSLYQITAGFDLSFVPLGRHKLKVRGNGQEIEYSQGFEVFETQKPELYTRLVLPSRFGRHAVATIFIEYGNTGNVAMSSPMLRLVSTDADNSDRPIMTLDVSRVRQNFWASSMPEGCGHSVQFLADGDGDSPGVLLPGEKGRIPVYYIGMLPPWNFNDNQVELGIRIVDGDETASFSWEEKKELMKPDDMTDEAWDIIFANLSENIGQTWGHYISTLSRDAAFIRRHSTETVRDTGQLMGMELLRALGYSPVPYLAGDIDISVPAPGLSLSFGRIFANSIISRHSSGPLGKGWRHNWEMSIKEETDGNVTFCFMDLKTRYTLSSLGGYFSPAGNHTTLSKSGDIFTITSPDGLKVRFHTSGSLDFVEDLNGNRITAGYTGDTLSFLQHSAGQRLEFFHDAAGRITSISGPGGTLSVSYAYTDEQLHGVMDISCRATLYQYFQSGPAQNALSAISHADGRHSSFFYDNNGRLSRMQSNQDPPVDLNYGDAGMVTLTHTGNGAQQVYYYNHKGQFIKYNDPLNQSTEFSFDNSRNLSGISLPDGGVVNYAYNPSGNLTRITDPLQQVTRFLYGANSRLTGVTDPENKTHTYTYDNKGNIQSGISTDLTAWHYDADTLGQIVTVKNRRGSQITLTRDSNGRIIRRDYPDSSFTEYTYNDAGLLTSARDAAGTTTLAYDPAFRLTRITYPQGWFLAYTYNAQGYRTSMSDHQGNTDYYGYTPEGRLETITDSQSQELVRYTYDVLKRLSRRTLGNGVYTTYAYDLNNRLTSIDTYNAADGLISFYHYGYDALNRKTSMQTPEGAWEYGYDASGQLTLARFTSSSPVIPSKEIFYTYDKAGNRTGEIDNGGSLPYTVNTMNQYTQAGSFTYMYDDDGNLVQKSNGHDILTYAYNDDNRLVKATGPEGETLYTYNALGHLTSVTENGAVRQYMTDPAGFGNIAAELDSDGNITGTCHHGFGLVSKDDGFYSFDGNGNTSEVTGTGAAVLNTYRYEPFGAVIREAETRPNAFKFAGQFGVMQMADDLIYMRNRFYAPSLGRFVSEDPIGLHGGDVSFYRYCLNDPVNFVDPLGLFYFGKRPLGNGNFGGSTNPIDDYFNTETVHEHGFFEDGSGENVGFGPKGRYWNEDPTGKRYSFYIDKKYDDVIMREALKRVTDGNYNLLFNNCQDWADRLRAEYEKILEEMQKNNPCP